MKNPALRGALGLRALLCMALLCGALAAVASDKPPQMRSLEGVVTNAGDVPLNDAIVYLTNTRTMVVKTYITQQDGVYRFNALSPNVDYEVYAAHEGKKSGTKTLSSFDSRTSARINLKINAEK
jgi:Carboxypeptidase regulatory-like domain